MNDVSIHAPAWGATRQASLMQHVTLQFQSTRPRGARLTSTGARNRRARCFNPRARVGRDCVRKFWSSRSTSFNPRARVGRDSHLVEAGCK